jgi:hypothetical protein
MPPRTNGNAYVIIIDNAFTLTIVPYFFSADNTDIHTFNNPIEIKLSVKNGSSKIYETNVVLQIINATPVIMIVFVIIEYNDVVYKLILSKPLTDGIAISNLNEMSPESKFRTLINVASCPNSVGPNF